MMQRMKKAREEAEFKKKMTERSNFAATKGTKKAKKMINSGKVQGNPQGGFSVGIEKKAHKSGIGQVEVKELPQIARRPSKLLSKPPKEHR